MTLDEAIQHAKEVAVSNAACGVAYRKGGQSMLADSCEACAAEHAQLAGWLEELRDLRAEAQSRAADLDSARELIKALRADVNLYKAEIRRFCEMLNKG